MGLDELLLRRENSPPRRDFFPAGEAISPQDVMQIISTNRGLATVCNRLVWPLCLVAAAAAAPPPPPQTRKYLTAAATPA